MNINCTISYNNGKEFHTILSLKNKEIYIYCVKESMRRSNFLNFDLTFNPILGCSINKTVNDIESITISRTIKSSNKSLIKNNNIEYYKNIISKRQSELKILEQERNDLILKLEDLTLEELSEINDDILFRSKIIGNHKKEIADIEYSFSDITYYSVDIPRGVTKCIQYMPEQTIPFKISWQSIDDRISPIKIKNTIETYTTFIKKINPSDKDTDVKKIKTKFITKINGEIIDMSEIIIDENNKVNDLNISEIKINENNKSNSVQTNEYITKKNKLKLKFFDLFNRI